MERSGESRASQRLSSAAFGFAPDDSGMSPEEKAQQAGTTLLPVGEAFTEMTTKLLQGWTMMNETCPISDFPLVRSPDGNMIYSIRCQCEVRNPEKPDPQQETNIDPPNLQEKHTTLEMERSSDSQENSCTEEPLISNAVVITDNKPDISGALASKLLLGWTMLAETCPITGSCPLMQSPEGRRWSAALDGFIEDGDNNIKGGDKSWENTVIDRQDAPKVPTTNKQDCGEDEKETQRMSQEISRLLLKGWTMLEETCPITGQVPLLQDPQTKRKYSVAVGKFTDENSADDPRVRENDQSPLLQKPDLDVSTANISLTENPTGGRVLTASKDLVDHGCQSHLLLRANEVVRNRLHDTVTALERSGGTSPESDTALVRLIRECAACLREIDGTN